MIAALSVVTACGSVVRACVVRAGEALAVEEGVYRLMLPWKDVRVHHEHLLRITHEQLLAIKHELLISSLAHITYPTRPHSSGVRVCFDT
jgi:hypothetical protein